MTEDTGSNAGTSDGFGVGQLNPQEPDRSRRGRPDQPSKFHKGTGKGRGRGPPPKPKSKQGRDPDKERLTVQDMEVLRAAIRHEQQFNILEADRSYIFSVETKDLRIVPIARASEHDLASGLRSGHGATLWGVLLIMAATSTEDRN